MSPTAWRFFTARRVDEKVGESKDGVGAGDNDKPYRPWNLSVSMHFPFTDLQYLRLMFMRSRVRDGLLRGDSWSEPLKDEVTD